LAAGQGTAEGRQALATRNLRSAREGRSYDKDRQSIRGNAIKIMTLLAKIDPWRSRYRRSTALGMRRTSWSRPADEARVVKRKTSAPSEYFRFFKCGARLALLASRNRATEHGSQSSPQIEVVSRAEAHIVQAPRQGFTPRPSSPARAALGRDRDRRCAASIDVGLRRSACGRPDPRRRAESGRYRI